MQHQPVRSEQDKKETRWHGHLSKVTQMACVLEANECGDAVLDKVNLANENVVRFAALWNLAHERLVQLIEFVRNRREQQIIK